MEFEALFLGIEPLTALAVGLGAVVLVHVVNAVGKAVEQDSTPPATMKPALRRLTVYEHGGIRTPDPQDRNLSKDQSFQYFQALCSCSTPILPQSYVERVLAIQGGIAPWRQCLEHEPQLTQALPKPLTIIGIAMLRCDQAISVPMVDERHLSTGQCLTTFC